MMNLESVLSMKSAQPFVVIFAVINHRRKLMIQKKSSSMITDFILLILGFLLNRGLVMTDEELVNRAKNDFDIFREFFKSKGLNYATIELC